jgi:HEAT repeat protein
MALLFLTNMGFFVGFTKNMARPSRNPVPVLKPPSTDEEIAADVASLIATIEQPRKAAISFDDSRLLAAVFLGKIGPPAVAALPALQKLTTDKDPAVSSAAKAAIASITKPPPEH